MERARVYGADGQSERIPWITHQPQIPSKPGVPRMADQFLRWRSGGGWKGNKNEQVLNRYISVEQLLTDAELAGILDVGGPVWYKLKADSHVDNSFLQGIIMSKMYEHFGVDQSNTITDALALPVLWTCHEPTLAHMISSVVRLVIQEGYNIIRGANPYTYNPFIKVPLHMSRV
jgi:hypothetical protein